MVELAACKRTSLLCVTGSLLSEKVTSCFQNRMQPEKAINPRAVSVIRMRMEYTELARGSPISFVVLPNIRYAILTPIYTAQAPSASNHRAILCHTVLTVTLAR